MAVLLNRYLNAVGRIGVAIRWRDGIHLDLAESLIPEKLDARVRDWLFAHSPRPPDWTSRVTESTVAVASIFLPFQGLSDLLVEIRPDLDRETIDNFKLLLKGIFLGRDPLEKILPELDPRAVLTLDVRRDRTSIASYAWSIALGWSERADKDDIARPIDNALRTALAAFAFDPQHQKDHLRVVGREEGGDLVAELTDGTRSRLAYRIGTHRLVLGNQLASIPKPGSRDPGPQFDEIKRRWFPDAETFAIVDISRCLEEFRVARTPLIRALAERSGRSPQATALDLDNIAQVASLFRAATFHVASKRETSLIRRSLSLIAR